MTAEADSAPQIAAYIETAAALQNLPADAAAHPSVAAHFAALRAAAGLVMAAPIADLVEIAPIFQP